MLSAVSVIPPTTCSTPGTWPAATTGRARRTATPAVIETTPTRDRKACIRSPQLKYSPLPPARGREQCTTRIGRRPSVVLELPACDPLHPCVIGEPVHNYGCEYPQGGDICDPLALRNGGAEHEQRERHRGHSLGAEPRHERLPGGADLAGAGQ